MAAYVGTGGKDERVYALIVQVRGLIAILNSVFESHRAAD